MREQFLVFTASLSFSYTSANTDKIEYIDLYLPLLYGNGASCKSFRHIQLAFAFAVDPVLQSASFEANTVFSIRHLVANSKGF